MDDEKTCEGSSKNLYNRGINQFHVCATRSANKLYCTHAVNPLQNLRYIPLPSFKIGADNAYTLNVRQPNSSLNQVMRGRNYVPCRSCEYENRSIPMHIAQGAVCVLIASLAEVKDRGSDMRNLLEQRLWS